MIIELAASFTSWEIVDFKDLILAKKGGEKVQQSSKTRILFFNVRYNQNNFRQYAYN